MTLRRWYGYGTSLTRPVTCRSETGHFVRLLGRKHFKCCCEDGTDTVFLGGNAAG